MLVIAEFIDIINDFRLGGMLVVIGCRTDSVNHLGVSVFVSGEERVEDRTAGLRCVMSRFMFTGKNAWKVGLLGLNAFGVYGVGAAIWYWGPPLYDPDGKCRNGDRVLGTSAI